MHRCVIEAIKRDRQAGMKIEAIAVCRDLDPAIVRAVLNGTYKREVRSSEKDERIVTAKQLAMRGTDPHIVWANFCDVATRRQRAAWMYEQEEITFDAIKLDKKLREIVEFAERFKGQGHQVGQTEYKQTPAG